MKKRILTILLVSCAVICLATAVVFAMQPTDVATEEELFAAVRNGGYVRMTDNITVERGTLITDYTTELDLNGHTLTFREPGMVLIKRYNGGGEATGAIAAGIAVNSNFTIVDSDENKKGKIDVWGDDSTGIYVGPTGNMSMWSGTLTNSSVTIPDESEESPKYTTSVGIFILRGKVSMTSGSRIENESQAGVMVCGGTFSMAGGSTVISGCGIQSYYGSYYYGGGVHVTSEKDENGNTVLGSFALNMGARIENCSAYNGGGVYLSHQSVFTINAGSITGCKAAHGGGVYVSSVGKVAVEDGQYKCITPAFTMNGGTIENCTADNSGGGVYIDGGNVGSYLIEFKMNAGSIKNCSSINGGGISVDKYGTFTMSGSAAINGCKATGLSGVLNPEGYGGGVYMFPGGSIDMSGGSITGCQANAGYSIYSDSDIQHESKYNVTGGTAAPTASLAYLSGTKVIRMEGLGTAAYPYHIGTKDQLFLFRDIVNGTNGQTQNLGACAVLTNDIVLNDGTFDDDGNYTSGLIGATPEEWTPIGDSFNAYSGTFNGAGHTIKGLYYTGSNVDEYEYTAGLFASLDGATVMNLTVTGYIQRGDNQLYGYKGRAGGIAGQAQNSTIRNCRSSCRITTAPDRGFVGGIVGSISGTTTIENCRNDGYITELSGDNSAAGGIVGNMEGGTVKGCINTGKVDCTRSAQNQAGIGGIVGRAFAGTVSDCINIGEVNVVLGTCYAGGIIGYTEGDGITIRSCYSVGTVTAENGLKAGGICGTTRGGTTTFKNCYCLDSSSFYAIGYRPDEEGSVEKKRMVEFADGTVLTALIDGRADGEHPWDTEGCKPISDDVNDTTELPVFAWMNLAARHHGGTAYCNSAKLCEGCGKAYGDPDPVNHAPDGKQEWIKTATAHEKKWSCCGAVTVVSEAHEWTDGVCRECGYVCTHTDGNKDHICDYCKKTFSDHTDKDKNHVCDYCGKTLSIHEDANKDHLCDYCGDPVSDHIGGKATCKDKAVCGICGKAYGELDAKNHSDLVHVPAKAATQDAEGNIEYWYCSGCGKYYGDAAAANEIAKADTVTEKLPADPVAPPTGDGTAYMLWIALLVGGAALTAVTVLGKKKKSL